LRKAAEQGFGKAQNKLGIFYRDGIGVSSNPVESYAWFATAAANDYIDAVKNRDEIEKKLTPEQLQQAKDLAVSYTSRYKQSE
jgi:TPR repeat protein